MQIQRSMFNIMTLLGIIQTMMFQQYGEQKINALNILLPISSDYNSEYILEAFNGCYNFESDTPEIISVKPFTSDACGRHAKIIVNTNTKYNKSIFINVIEINTKTILKCEVRVGAIYKIKIVTRQKFIDTGVFETIELIGFDIHGNTFSTLEGLKFDWIIEQQGDIAKISNFQRSGFQTTERRHLIESMGGMNDIIVINTLIAGSFTLNVFLKDSSKKDISANMLLRVVDNIIVHPEELFMLQHSFQQLSFMRVKRDINGRYYESITDIDKRFIFKQSKKNKIVIIENQGVIRSGVDNGSEIIAISDNDNKLLSLQTNVHVVEAEKTVFTIYQVDLGQISQIKKQPSLYQKIGSPPVQNVIVGKSYVIHFDILTSNNKHIMIDNETVEWSLPDDISELIFQSKNYIITKILKSGALSIEAQIKKQQYQLKDIIGKRDIQAFNALQIIAPMDDKRAIFLPSLKDTSEAQTMIINVIGGSGRYSCQSQNSQIIKTLADNIISVGNKNGSSVITCSDQYDDYNTDKITVIVEDVKSVQGIERQKEGIVDEQINFYIGALSQSGNHFANCTNITYEPIITDSSNVYDAFINKSFEFVKELVQIAKSISPDFMASLPVTKALTTNNYVNKKDKLRHKISLFDNFGICSIVQTVISRSGGAYLRLERNKLKQALDSNIVVYDRVKIVQPNSYNAKVFGKSPRVQIGSSIYLKITGGPNRLNNNTKRLISTDNDKYAEAKISENNIKINCKDTQKTNIEKVNIQLMIHSVQTKELPLPVSLFTQFTIKCAYPKTAQLIIIKDNDLLQSLQQQSYQAFVMHIQKASFFAAWVFDHTNKPLWSFNFQHSQNKLIIDNKEHDVTLKETRPYDCLPDNISNNGHFCFVLLSQSYTGPVQIITSMGDMYESSDASKLEINFTNQISLSPNINKIIAFDQNVIQFQINGGSGEFKVISDNDQKLLIDHQQGFSSFTASPIISGQVKIIIQDIKAVNSDHFNHDVSIYSDNKIQLIMPKKMFIQGEIINVETNLNNQLLSQLMKAGIQLTIMSDTHKEVSTCDKEGHFKLKLTQKGTYELFLTNNKNNKIGQQTRIEIFEPIRAFPDNILMMPDCIGHVIIMGGPQQINIKNMLFLKDQEQELVQVQKISNTVFQLKGLKLMGKGKIIIQLKDDKGILLQEQQIQIELTLPDSIITRGPVKLLTGVTGIYQLTPSSRNRPLFASHCEFNFTYELTDKSSSIELLNLHQQNKNGMPFGQLMITGHIEGRYNLTATMNYTGNVTIESQRFPIKHIIVISVINNYQLPLPSIYHSPLQNADKKCQQNILFGQQMFMIPPFMALPLPKNLSLKCINQNGIFNILEGNILRANEKEGQSSLLVTDMESGVQTGVVVSIETPNQLILEGMEKVQLMQVNHNYELGVKFADKYGRLYPSPLDKIDLFYFVSGQDVVQITYDPLTQKMIVYASNEGETIIFVQSKTYPNLNCLFQVKTGQIISPKGPLFVHTGSSISFVLTKDMDSNIFEPLWKSSDSSLVSIDKRAGIALAHRKGTAFISSDFGIAPEIEINVGEVAQINFLKNCPKTISNQKNDEHTKQMFQCSFDMILSPFSQILQSTDAVSNNLDIQCVTDTELIKAKTTTVNGRFTCLLFFTNANEITTSALLSVIISQPKLNFHFSESLPIQIQPSLKELFPYSKIFVTKSKKIHIEFKTKSILQLSYNEALEPFINNVYDSKTGIQTIDISIKGNINKMITTTLNVSWPEAKQQIKLDVIIDPQISFFQRLFVKTNFNMGFNELTVCIVCIILSIFLVKQILINKRKLMTNRNSYQFIRRQQV